MADLQKQFSAFHDRISLTTARKVALRASRDAIRDRIRTYFREILKLMVPKFRGQGSYAMGTTVNPIDGEYDIDDGVYLQHLDHQNDSDWPAAGTVHQWQVKATDGHTNEKTMGKRTCVRVRFAGQYHVDLPSYGELNGQYHLAVRGEARWPHSDPLALTDWFVARVNLYGEQLRRIVRYLKAWADFQSKRRGKMPRGLILTVLAANYYQKHEKDDVALANTLQAISNAVSGFFFIHNPADPNEELTARLTRVQKLRFQEAVKAASESAISAVVDDDDHAASKVWRKQFGDRFPLVPEKEDKGITKQTREDLSTTHS